MINFISRNCSYMYRTIASGISTICSRISSFARSVFARREPVMPVTPRASNADAAAATARNYRRLDASVRRIEERLPIIEQKASNAFDAAEARILGQCARVESAFARVGAGIDRVTGVDPNAVDALMAKYQQRDTASLMARMPQVPK